MAQVLDPLPLDQIPFLLCCYVNATNQIQIARITNVDNWYFERVVFPGQRLVFEAPLNAQLEIHTGKMASAILSDIIPCQELVITEDEDGRQLKWLGDLVDKDFESPISMINKSKETAIAGVC